MAAIVARAATFNGAAVVRLRDDPAIEGGCPGVRTVGCLPPISAGETALVAVKRISYGGSSGRSYREEERGK